jgi:O-antigen ligase
VLTFFSLLKTKCWLPYLFFLFCAVIPWSLAGMQIAAILVVFGTITFAIVHKKNPITFHSFYIFIGIYFISQLLAIFFSTNPIISFFYFLHTDWFILCIPFLISIPLSEREKLIAIKILIGSAAMVSIYGLIQFFGGMEYFRGEEMNQMGNFFRAEGGYNFYLTFAGNQLMIFAFGFSLYLFERNWKPEKIFYFITTGLIFFSIMATFARSTWIALIIIILVGSWLVNRHFFGLITAGLIIIGFVTSFLSPEIYERIVSIFDPSQNQARVNLWKTSWAMFSKHKIFGIGPGLFNNFFPDFEVPGYYDAAGHAHNDYLNFATLSGLVGLVSWITMWIAWFYYTISGLRKNVHRKPDIQILFGSVLAIFAILIAAFFQCYYTDLENNILWWTVISFSILILNQKKLQKNNN